MAGVTDRPRRPPWQSRRRRSRARREKDLRRRGFDDRGEPPGARRHAAFHHAAAARCRSVRGAAAWWRRSPGPARGPAAPVRERRDRRSPGRSTRRAAGRGERRRGAALPHCGSQRRHRPVPAVPPALLDHCFLSSRSRPGAPCLLLFSVPGRAPGAPRRFIWRYAVVLPSTPRSLRAAADIAPWADMQVRRGGAAGRGGPERPARGTRESSFESAQGLDAVVGRRVRSEQAVHAPAGERIDDEQVRGRRVALGVEIGDAPRPPLELAERGDQPRGRPVISALARSAEYSRVRLTAIWTRMAAIGSHYRGDQHADEFRWVVVVAAAAKKKAKLASIEIAPAMVAVMVMVKVSRFLRGRVRGR